jgi:hypothetical protein
MISEWFLLQMIFLQLYLQPEFGEVAQVVRAQDS